jgi:excisionase family DNA binding protein
MEKSERAVYSVEEGAVKLDLNIKSVYEGIRAGEIPSIRIGRRILIPKLALDRLLEGKAAGQA